MRKIVNFCDYFVLSSGTSDRHVRSIADAIDEKLSEQGVHIRNRRGLQKGDWVVVDLGDIVVHVFQQSVREFYRLEYLWQDAKTVNWKK